MELLVIGLDGFSYNILHEFDVDTPFLPAVQLDGIAGDLSSVDTPPTLPGWMSFATGKDPGSHGVATMLQQPSDYAISPASRNTTDAALYDHLAGVEFRRIVAGVSFRAEQIELRVWIGRLGRVDGDVGDAE